MSKAIAILGLAALLSTHLRTAAEEKTTAKVDASDLVGAYTIVAGEKDGVKEPEERIKGTTVRFTEDAIVVTTPDKKDVFAASYKLGTDRRPRGITMTSKLAPNEGEIARGLIDKEGDTVRLIYALPGGETPTEFKTRDKQLMFVMKKVNP